MMKRLLLLLFVGLLAAGSFTSCLDDDNEEVQRVTVCPPPVSHIDRHNLRPMSAGRFYSAVAGSGWREVSTYEIDADGTVSAQDYWKDMIGAGSTDYYFSRDSVTEFYYVDAYPAWMNWTRAYRYDATRNAIDKGDTPEYQDCIFDCDGDWMYMLQSLGYSYNNGVRQDHYGIACYRRMTADELAATWKAYPQKRKDPGTSSPQ